MRKPWMRCITWYLIVAMFIIGIAPRVYAGFSPSEVTGLLPFDRAADLQKIQKVIEMKVISERLRQLGLTPDEIQRRIGLLSDQQVHQLALQLDELKVGGNGFEIVIALLVIGILVVVLIYLLDRKIIITR